MRQGGSYKAGDDGKLQVVEEPTKDHPEGNAARDAEGRRLDRTPPATEDAAPGPENAATKPELGPMPVDDVKSPPVSRRGNR